jgi:hypothetical protein
MSYYPTEETFNEPQPICPNCGHEFDTSEGDYYPKGSEEDFEATCPDCDLELVIWASTEVTWTIAHPDQCLIKGYHVPYFSEEHNKHECLYCRAPLTCSCTLHEQCTHNLKVEA